MAWTFSLPLLPSFAAGAVALTVAALAWEHRSERTGRPFIVLMLALAWWAFAYGIELGYADASSILLWDKIAFVGSVTAPAALFWLAVEYAGLDDELPAWAPAVLVLEPVVTLAFAWAYPGSRLVWESVAVTDAGPLALPAIDFGPWYWVNFAYSYVLVGSALVFVAWVFVRGSGIYRRQAALLIAGAAVPLGANLVYNLFPALSPFPSIDLTTFALTATGALYGLCLFRFRMLDLAPVARGLLPGEVGDGYVVVDADGASVEGNEVGREVAERAAGFPDEPPTDGLVDLDGRLVSVPDGAGERTYEARTTPVTDFRDERVGTLVVFRDITELEVLRAHEQRLAVMNRVLRHTIRNEMNVIKGYGDTLARSLEGEQRSRAELIARTAERMATMGEKARHLRTELDAPGELRPEDVVPIVESVVERASRTFPSATVSLAGSDAAAAMLAGREDLEVAVEYVVENAVVHHDGDHPTVDVSVTRRPDTVDISVADTGPGIPAFEREAVESGIETPLEHGSGLGLWIVRWLVTRSDGRLEFEDNEPRGSVVTIRVPAAE